MRLYIPLLGLGALLSFLTKLVKAWLSRVLSPTVDTIFAWLAQLLEPERRIFMSIGRFIGRIVGLFFGWMLELHLPFAFPDWIWKVAKIALFTVVAFSVNKSNLNREKKQFEKSLANTTD